MAQHRKILIADPDLEAARGLSKALRQRGYQVHYAPDGSRALEVAVLRHPDLILFDEGCRLIEAKTFSQILRTNPRTEDIPVVLTTAAFDALHHVAGLPYAEVAERLGGTAAAARRAAADGIAALRRRYPTTSTSTATEVPS